MALWILAEIDLNRAGRYRNTFTELLWSFGHRNPPIAFYPIGGQMLRSFQHVKRSARYDVPAFLYIDMVVGAVLVWAGRDSYGIKRLPKAVQFFMDGFVTLYCWILTAKTAP